MLKKWSVFFGMLSVALFLSSAATAQHRGGGGGSHGGGGGGFSGRSGGGGGSFNGRSGGDFGNRSGGRDFNGRSGDRSNFNRSQSFGSPHSQGSSPRFNGPGNPGQPRGGHHPNYGPSPWGGRYVGPHHPNYGPWHHGYWHDHWARPWYVGPVGWWSVGFVSGALVWDSPWYWGYWPYYNPYNTNVIIIDNTRIDYSQPIALAAPPAPEPGTPVAAASTVAENQAVQLLNASRAAFARGDYPAAMSLVNQSIAKNPADPVPHEFRALILFADKQYKEAAATVYAVMSMGPGWDWATLGSFYPNVDTYTAQLRALEQYRNENPTVPEAWFLLAYHYMCCGHPEAAADMLRAVIRLNPKDQLASQLLAGLAGGDQETPPAPAEPAAPPVPIQAASLVGNWTATRAEGESFDFTLTGDTYTWKYVRGEKSQVFSGGYTVADNLLILKQNGNPVMIGQVAMFGDGRFNFKLAGNNPSDPGLTFSRK